jgi:REP element-mobilizing transposase RayT
MPQSLVKNIIHIIFSTKNRNPWIDDPIRSELFKYIGGICKNMECYPIIVGGYTDHVHILCLLSKKIPLMKLLQEVKSHSSKWIKTKHPRYRGFQWQNGYAAFSVENSDLNRVKSYIKHQPDHHKKKPFQSELLTILGENQIHYNEKFLWS